jgi:penicillin-binding protein 2
MDSLSSVKNQSWLSWFLRGLLIIALLTLLTKMFDIQIIRGSYYRGLSEENRIRHIPIPASRGRILARGGEILVANVEVKKRIKFSASGAYELTDDLTDAEAQDIITDYKRSYLFADKFAHASGYLGEVGDQEVGKIDPDCPEKGPRVSGQFIGKTGLEAQYECLLLGIPGEELIEVNTQGKKIRSLGRKEPIPGQDLKTTIDANLQSEIATDMEGKKGAAIITDTHGEVLAFYSSPSFDPNLLVSKRDNQKISELFKNTDLPFFNRVIGGTFHPGSVFKPIVALAALQEGAIDKSFVFDDPGVIEVNGFSYSNWYFSEYGRREGQIGLTRAIARSTDTFFYKIGEMVGPDAIANWSKKFGLDKETGIDIPGETNGLIPSPEWKKKVKKENWFLGNTYHMAIGQGDVALTPIEINSYISAIASGGQVCEPRLSSNQKENCRTVNVRKENLDLIKEGMKEACSAGGTAYTFFDFAVKHGDTDVACKTGTAQIELDGETHAWFTFFAPKENPQIVATILVEKGGQGSSVAGPIARKIADLYFSALKQ